MGFKCLRVRPAGFNTYIVHRQVNMQGHSLDDVRTTAAAIISKISKNNIVWRGAFVLMQELETPLVLVPLVPPTYMSLLSMALFVSVASPALLALRNMLPVPRVTSVEDTSTIRDDASDYMKHPINHPVHVLSNGIFQFFYWDEPFQSILELDTPHSSYRFVFVTGNMHIINLHMKEACGIITARKQIAKKIRMLVDEPVTVKGTEFYLGHYNCSVSKQNIVDENGHAIQYPVHVIKNTAREKIIYWEEEHRYIAEISADDYKCHIIVHPVK